jgi:cyanophycin synthetase
VRAWHEDITRTAFHQARDLLVAAMDGGHVRDAGAFPDAAAMDGEHAGRPGAASGPATKDYDALPFDVPAAVGVLRGMADALLLGPITQSIVDVATARDRRIPAIRLDAGKLVQLGYGVRGRRILVAGDARRAHAAVRQVQAQAAVERHVDGARREIAEIGVSVSEAGRGANRQGDAPAWVDAGYNLVGNVSSDGGIGPEATRVLVERLFPGGDSGRIPVIGVAGSHGTARVARLIAWLVGQDERRVGLACGQGLFLGPQRIDPGDCAHWAPARRLLCDPRVEVAVIENGMEAMLREGLAYDRCQVGVLTNIDPARLPDDGYVDRPERLCMLMRTQVDVVLPGGAAVLNATDPLAAEMASLSDGEVIFFSSDPDHPVVLGHCAAGGRAVTLAEQRVTLVQGSKAAEVFDLRVLTWVGGESCLIDGLLAAVAAAWAADLTPDRIRDGLAGFRAQELG